MTNTTKAPRRISPAVAIALFTYSLFAIANAYLGALTNGRTSLLTAQQYQDALLRLQGISSLGGSLSLGLLAFAYYLSRDATSRLHFTLSYLFAFCALLFFPAAIWLHTGFFFGPYPLSTILAMLLLILFVGKAISKELGLYQIVHHDDTKVVAYGGFILLYTLILTAMVCGHSSRLGTASM